MRLVLTAVLAATLPICLSAQPNLDATVERARQEFNVPGIAVAVVKDGRVVLAKGFGVRKLGDPAAVTADTLFGIASNSKAFTGAALAMLVDEGKVKWDEPVLRYLPQFQMYDPYVTREMTVRDLLVHRSGLGLGAGDLMYFPTSDLSSDEIVKRLRYVRPSTSFRSTYNYDNILYLVAGKVIEAASGKPWDVFIQERFLAPLGMTTTTTSVKGLKPGMNFAYPHAPADGKLQTVAFTVLDNNAPAAALNSSVNEMTKWVLALLNGGEYNGKRLFSARQARELWSPVTIMPNGNQQPELAATRPNMRAYALGWNVSDYRGHKLVSHTGGLAGMVTSVMLAPDDKLGILVFTNQEQGSAFSAINYTVLDQYLNVAPTDWVAAYGAVRRRREAEAGAEVKAAAEKRNTASKPALPVASYAGRYRDSWYGDVVIEEKNGRLEMRFTHTPSLAGVLEHFQYDTFVARWADRTLLADAYVTFSLKADGSIRDVTMSAISPLTDFSYDFHDLLLRPVAPGTPAY